MAVFPIGGYAKRVRHAAGATLRNCQQRPGTYGLLAVTAICIILSTTVIHIESFRVRCPADLDSAL